ncbi:MAG: HK97 gp10 family phage protein [bacterium]|nr:HK97 gp10 family phage protein [bacterium]
MTVQLKNYKTFIENLTRWPVTLYNEVMEILTSEGNSMRNQILLSMRRTARAAWSYKRGKKRHHPSVPGSPAAIDEGELKDRIIAAADHSRGTMEIGVEGGAPYAVYLEDPDKLNRPFLMPVVVDNEARIMAKIQNRVQAVTE